MPPFRAVCFDLGGVLIRIHHTWDGAIEAAGVESSRTNIGSLGGFEAFEHYQDGQIEFQEYLTKLKEFLSLDFIEDAEQTHMSILRDSYPGALDLVQSLVENGKLVGCVSNTSESHWSTFFEGGDFDFGPLLQVRIGSHRVRCSKPDPAIFRAFEAESACKGSEILYFDDGHQNIEAASSLGWQAHLVDPEKDTIDQMRQIISSH